MILDACTSKAAFAYGSMYFTFMVQSFFALRGEKVCTNDKIRGLR